MVVHIFFRLSGSDVIHNVHLLLGHLEHLEPTEAELESEEDWR
jgi:hypothetical protein